MFETLKRLCENGKATVAHLDNAVSKGWITEEEKDMIVGGIYD